MRARAFRVCKSVDNTEQQKINWEGLGAEEKGMTEDEMAGWHHRLDGRQFE